MIIRIVLISLFILFLLRILMKHTNNGLRAWKKIGVVTLLVFAIFSVLYPDLTNKIAHLLGVGRGADLLLYCLTVSFIWLAISHYMRNKESERQIVKLARKIALMEADGKN